MGKKSKKTSSPLKISKHEKKPQLQYSMKILRPKVYITDTFNFKNLVQELTGNGKYEAAPPPPTTWEVPFIDQTYYQDFNYQHHHHDHHHVVCQENYTSSSSAGNTSVEASPEILTAAAEAEEERRKMEFYEGLEAMLMEMDYSEYSFCDYDNNACDDQMLLQQDQVYDYDFSNFV